MQIAGAHRAGAPHDGDMSDTFPSSGSSSGSDSGSGRRVIPYIDVHDGPRRLLTVDAGRFHLTMAGGASKPSVSIDGREFLVYQGVLTFEIPADRSVHVGIWANISDHSRWWMASFLLSPDQRPYLVWEKRGAFGDAGLVIPES